MSSEPLHIATFGFGQQNVLAARDFGKKACRPPLATLASLGFPAPFGFSLSIAICRDFYQNHETIPDDVPVLLSQGIGFLEHATGTVFGGKRRPLLVSVRSGAPVSMPGIMNTILNVGLTPQSLTGLIAKTGNPRFAYDTYRRFLQNFGECIFSHQPAEYKTRLQNVIENEGVPDERELDYCALRALCNEYLSLYITDEEKCCITDVQSQLLNCAIAVLRSWMNPRAREFRRINNDIVVEGTAVTIQGIVFGNIGASSGAGVAFTRNPWTGVREVLVDFRFGSQGDDVVSGARSAATQTELETLLPDVYRELLQISARPETHFRDMQDLEFTVQEGRLFILQTHSGKRAPLAELQIAFDLCEDGIITDAEVIGRVEGVKTDSLELQTIHSDEPPIAQGISASSGVAQGTIALSAERAVEDSRHGPVILVRETASPDDIEGIESSSGLLTARGARTSHAAVVARQMGKVCVANCTSLAIDRFRHRCSIGGITLREGDIITIDGNTGEVYRGKTEILRIKPVALIERLQTLQQRIGRSPVNR